MKFLRDKKELVKFDRKHCKTLLNATAVEGSADEAKLYLRYFFFSYTNKVFFFDGSKFILYTKEDALKLIPDDLKTTKMVPNDETKKFEKQDISLKSFLKSTEFMNIEYIPTIDFSTNDLIIKKKSRIGQFNFVDNLLNMAKPLNTDVIKGQEFIVTPEIESDTQIIFDHIEQVMCSGNIEVYNYVLNFICCTFNGRKVRKALYLQSKERTGKGIIINEVFKAILGERMYKTNSVESIIKYTKPFEGCCLLNFDELPHCDNYKGLQDSLKSLITEPEFNCRDMFSTGYEQKNTFNIIICTNNDGVALTQNNKERYVCLDISESKIGDFTYFKKLSKAINSKHVLEHFYNKMRERYQALPNDWYGDEMPFTENRKLKIIEALPCLYKHIKTTYILKNKDINVRTDKFLADYKTITRDLTTPQKIGRMLGEIGIKPIKNSNNQGYNYKKSAEELLEIFKTKNWIDENIDVINSDDLDNDDTEFEPSMFIKEGDKAEYIRAEQYIKEKNNFNAKIENLIELHDALKDDFNNAIEYIKQLERLVQKDDDIEVEEVKKETKTHCMFKLKKVKEEPVESKEEELDSFVDSFFKA